MQRQLDMDKRFVAAPNFRRLYLNFTKYKKGFKDLFKALPGFQLETGMACALGNLLQLSDGAAAFEPRLFSKLLPTLRNEKNLVILIYIRTGMTDAMALAGKRESEINKKPFAMGADAEVTVNCALDVKRNFISGNMSNIFEFDRIVWLVTSDSVAVKSWAIEHYDSVQKRKSKILPREVLVTGARGIHTRKRRDVSTVDFAEAFIDWYLIGESDVVVTSSSWYSFGLTASQRTARMVYEAKACARIL